MSRGELTPTVCGGTGLLCAEAVLVSEERQGLSSAQDWVEGLLEVHAAETVSRSLVVRVDVDATWAILHDLALDHAMKLLLRLVFATVPDGCAIDLEGSRSGARVASVSSGQWTVRWQVLGDAPFSSAGEPVRLRPRSGDAPAQITSAPARQVYKAFGASDWDFELRSIDGGQELLARAIRLE